MTMNFNYLPTLQHMLLVKRAVELCNHPEIKPLIKILRDAQKFESKSFAKCNTVYQTIYANARVQLLHLCVPESVRNKVELFVRPISEQINTWCEEHSRITPDLADVDFERDLVWKSDGTIKRQETAKGLIAAGKFETGSLFLLACHYCFEDEVSTLWNSMSDDEKKQSSKNAYAIVRFWATWMEKASSQLNWAEVAAIAPRNPAFFKRVFLKLTPNNRYQRLKLFVENELLHHTDLNFYFDHIDENHRAEIIREYPYEVLTLCLQWPIRNVFLNIARQFMPCLSEEQFCLLLYFIIFSRPSSHYHEYFEILNEIWFQSPVHYKAYVRGQVIHRILLFALGGTEDLSGTDPDDGTDWEISKKQLLARGWGRRSVDEAVC